MTRHFIIAACAAAVFLPGQSLVCAQETPVYVDDSPIAWELFREARDQADVNVGESVRLYQDLLDEFALRLIPADVGVFRRFQAVRLRVLEEIISDASPGGLLERHRIMEHAEAQRLQQAGENERLVLTRPWTEAGLEALLRVAQENIEAAHFDSAASVLDLAIRHPDLSTNLRAAAYTWFMLGVVAHYGSDAGQFERAAFELAALREAGERVAPALEEQLLALTPGEEVEADERPGPIIPRGISPLDVGTVSRDIALEELVAEEIWSLTLSETLYNRRYERVARGHVRRNRDAARHDAMLMTAAPTVVTSGAGRDNGLVYVNQGHHIMALDRFTGSPMWPLVGGYVERPPLTVIERDDDHARDLNVIAIEHDVLVTLTGHAHATSRSNDGNVLCLDANTGEFRWSTRIDRIAGPGIDEEEHEGLFPHSAPVIAEGKVFVLARKVSPQSLTSTYLVALHVEDGALAWIRHIASAGSIRRAARSFSTLQYLDGDLYLKTAVGAVARVAAATGETRWLHRFSVPLNPTSAEQMRRPWELDQPIVKENHVVCLLPSVPGVVGATAGPRVLVLERETGHEVVTYDATEAGWDGPAYLLSAGVNCPWIFAVGREVRAFHIDALGAPSWRLSVNGQPLEIRGRVHIVAPRESDAVGSSPSLVVPTPSSVLIVDGASGNVINTLYAVDLPHEGNRAADAEEASTLSGNPVVVDSQLFIAGNDRLRSFMAVPHAVGMLRERIEANPGDPEPGMALLRLAMAAAGSTGDERATAAFRNAPAKGELLPLINYSAGAVMRSIDLAPSPDTARQRQSKLFDLLLQLDVARVTTDKQQGESVFALMRHVLAAGGGVHPTDAAERGEAGSRENARQLVDYLLAYGDWLAGGRTPDSPDTSEFAQAVEAFSTIVDDPSLAAIKRREGDVIRPAHAWAQRRLARAGAAAHPNDGGRFSAAPRHCQLPLMGTQQGEAILLNGAALSAVQVATTGRATISEDRQAATVVLVDGGQLRLMEGDDLQERWRVGLGGMGGGGEIAGGTFVPSQQRIIAAFSGEGLGNAEIVQNAAMVDTEGGKIVWVTPGLDAVFGEMSRRAAGRGSLRGGGDASARGAGAYGGAGGRMEDAAAADIDRRETFAMFDEEAVYIVRRDGCVARFGFDDGSTATWVTLHALEEVHHADVRDGIIVMAGLMRGERRTGERLAGSGRGGSRGSLVAALLVIDAASGEVLHDGEPLVLVREGDGEEPRERAEEEAVNWMVLGDIGLVVCGTDAGVQAWDVATGAFLWMNASPQAQGTVGGWAAGQRVVVEASSGELRSIDLVEAVASSGYAIVQSRSPQDEWGSIRNVIVNCGDHESILAHHVQRLAWYDADGQVIGAEVIQENRNFRWVLPARDRVIAINAHHPRQHAVQGRGEPPAGPGSRSGMRTHYVYSVFSLAGDGRLLDDPIELPALFEPVRDAQLIDGWLLLSLAEHTVAVPYPVNSER